MFQTHGNVQIKLESLKGESYNDTEDLDKFGKGREMYYFTGHSSLDIFLEKIGQLLFPMGTYCICCGKYIDITRTYCICDQCMDAINWGFIYIDKEEEMKEAGRTGELDSVLSCMVYGLHSRQLVFDLKYNKRTYLARPLGMIMADRLLNDESLGDLVDRIDYVVPVPLHPSKFRTRGFNQADLISRELVKRIKENCPAKKELRCLSGALLRARSTQAQRSVTGGERFLNLEGAFSVDPGYAKKLKGAVILLVDDIFTTGATADRCAGQLKASGAAEVHFLSLATGNYYLKGSFRPRGSEDFLKESSFT